MKEEMKEAVFDRSKSLAAAQDYIDEFKRTLPSRVDSSTIPVRSRLALKAASVRDLCLHRVTDLGEVALLCFEADRILAGIVLTRAVLETVAIQYCLACRMQDVVTDKKVGDMDEWLMRVLVGCKDKSIEIEAINALTAVDHVDGQFEGYRGLYNDISEFVHPNWSGMHQMYADMDEATLGLSLSQKNRGGLGIGLSALIAGLHLCKVTRRGIVEMEHDFAQVCQE